VNATHSIILRDPDGGENRLHEASSVPYQNGTTYMFQEEGTYTFADPVSGKTGSITVVGSSEQDKSNTNETRATVGLIAVPINGDARFAPHLSRLGFNAVDVLTVEPAAPEQKVMGLSLEQT
jgi:hypothetical protein